MPRDKQLIKDMSPFATYVNDFQQINTVVPNGNPNQTLVRPTIRPMVSGGYCIGACIDWLRRSVTRAGEPVSTKSGKPPKLPQVMGRVGDPVPVGTNSQSRIDRMATIQEALNLAKNNKQKVKAPYQAALIVLEELSAKDPQQLTAEDKSRLELATRVIQHLEPANKKLEGKHLIHQVWPEVQHALGPMKAENGHGFDKVGIGASKGASPFEKYEDLVTEVLSLKGLKPGTGAIVGLRLRNKQTKEKMGGHAIAIYRDSEDSFFLFDPNLGVFSAPSKDKLMFATLMLLRHGYNDDEKELTNQGSWALVQNGQRETKPDAGEVDAAVKVSASTVKEKFCASAEIMDQQRTSHAEKILQTANTIWTKYQAALAKDDDTAALANQLKEIGAMKERIMAQNSGILPKENAEMIEKILTVTREKKKELDSRLDPKKVEPLWIAAKQQCTAAVEEAYMSVADASVFFPEFAEATDSANAGNLYV